MRPITPSILLLVLAVLAGCSAEPDGAGDAAGQVDPTLPAATSPAEPAPAPTQAPAPTRAPAPTQAPTPPTAPAGTDTAAPVDPAPADPDPAAATLALEQVATLDQPIAMAVRPGDANLYVAERPGRVRAIRPDGSVGDPIVDITDQTTTESERGLLGLTWSAQGDRLFLSSTGTDGATVLEAHDLVDGVLSATPTELLRVPQPASNHNGGNVVIGPDGHLWLGLGDGGASDDRFGNGQDPSTLLGTLLRLDPTADGYDIPPDNPWADGGAGAPEVWAYGLRNPWRFAFDPVTGDLWVADVGQGAVEEVDRVPADAAGLNYGWPRFEGDRPFDGQPLDGESVEPVHTYTHQRGCSITGGYVYRGQAIPALVGAYLYTDYCDGEIHALDLDAEGNVEGDVATGLTVEQPISFGQGPDGELYVLSQTGSVQRIVGG